MGNAALDTISRLARSAAAHVQNLVVKPYASAAGAFARPSGPDPIGFLRDHPLVQPDQTTCGSASLLVADMIADPQLAARILGDPGDAAAVTTAQDRFAAEALSIHDRTNALVSPSDELQFPWPKSLGTQPWAAARFLDQSPFGRDWDVFFVDPKDPGAVFDRLARSVADGFPCPFFIGDSASPRHVVLAAELSGNDLVVYEPSGGVLVNLTRADFVAGRTGALGWDQPWLAVSPR
jgi:hypothetical protein